MEKKKINIRIDDILVSEYLEYLNMARRYMGLELARASAAVNTNTSLDAQHVKILNEIDRMRHVTMGSRHK